MANKINYTGSSKILQRLCAAVNELIDGGSYSLPTASENVKGGIKVGDGLTMDGEVLKNLNPTPATPYTLPIASANTLGGIKVGNNLSIDQNGVLSATGGGGGDTVSVNQILSSGTKIAEITVGTTTTDLYAPAGGGGGGNAMWRVLFYNASGTEALYREYVANGDDCIYGANKKWATSVGGTEVPNVTKNITQNKTLYNLASPALHIWTKSTGGYDAAMYVQKGDYDANSQIFTPDGEATSVIYTSVQGQNTFDCYGMATLGYPSNWKLYASQTMHDGDGNTYEAGDLIKQWSYSTAVDFYISLGAYEFTPATGVYLPYSEVNKIICEADLNNFDSASLRWGYGSKPIALSNHVNTYAQDVTAVHIPTSSSGILASVNLGSNNEPFTAYIVMKLINPGQYSRIFSAFNARSSGNGIMLYGSTINVSSWANDTSTGVSSSNYFVGCIRYNPGASPSAYGKVNNATGITKSPSTAGQYITIGRTDIDSNTTNAEPCDSLVKFVGVVSEAESDSVVQQNIAHLMSTFNIT